MQLSLALHVGAGSVVQNSIQTIMRALNDESCHASRGMQVREEGMGGGPLRLSDARHRCVHVLCVPSGSMPEMYQLAVLTTISG